MAGINQSSGREKWGKHVAALPTKGNVEAGVSNLIGKNGRSGGIRTHDPQSPRLMRYQTALRSGRGAVSSSVAAAVQRAFCTVRAAMPATPPIR